MIDKKIVRIFGTRLREIREEKEMSLRRLAKLSRISPAYLSGIETGKYQPPSWRIIGLISRALFDNPLYLNAYALLSKTAAEIMKYER